VAHFSLQDVPSHNATTVPQFSVKARARPTVAFQRDHMLLSTIRNETAALELTGRAPWAVTVTFVPDGAAAGEPPRRLSLNVSAAAAAVLHDVRPGRYELVSVRDSFCTGQVLEPSRLVAKLAPLPTVSWDLAGAPSAVCLGAAPAAIPLTFTGRGPWHLTYTDTVRALPPALQAGGHTV